MKKLIGLLSLLVIALVLSSCDLVNPVFTITCTLINLKADSAQYTVDNTGSNDERVFVRAYDGYGTLILNDDESGPVGVSSTTSLDEDYSYDTPPRANPIRAEIFSPAGNDLAQDTVWFSAVGSCAGLPDATVQDAFQDGRINYRDAGAPFVIYQVDHDFYIYWVEDQPDGQPELIVTADEIDAVPNPPAENTLIASSETHDVQVYRLTDGRLHFRAKMANGKTYIVLLASDGSYVSLEEQ